MFVNRVIYTDQNTHLFNQGDNNPIRLYYNTVKIQVNTEYR